EVGVRSVLDSLTGDDTRLVYEAIRASGAGGLGRAEHADVLSEPPPDVDLVEAMRLAADRDFIARQYTNDFADVFDGAAAWIAEGLARGWPLSTAIIHAHVRQIAA